MRDVTLPFWVIEKTECDQSYCNEREDHIWSSGFGEFFYHESYCNVSVIMTIYGFQFFFVTSVPGCRGYILIWHMGGICPYIGPSTPPRVFGGTKTEHTLLLSTITFFCQSHSRTRISFGICRGIFVCNDSRREI